MWIIVTVMWFIRVNIDISFWCGGYMNIYWMCVFNAVISCNL